MFYVTAIFVKHCYKTGRFLKTFFSATNWGYLLHVEHISCVITNCVLLFIQCLYRPYWNEDQMLSENHYPYLLDLFFKICSCSFSYILCLHWLDWNYIGTMKTSWTCYAGTQSFDVVTTTHMESGWDLGVLFVCLFVLECLELQITFFSVDGLVVWLRCLSGRIVVHIISMQDIYHNFLCNDGLVGWLSFLIVKTVNFLITYHS